MLVIAVAVILVGAYLVWQLVEADMVDRHP